MPKLHLITDIARQLQQLTNSLRQVPLDCVEVAFFDNHGEQLSAGGVGTMLEYLVEDTHMDGDCNDISGVTRVEVRTI